MLPNNIVVKSSTSHSRTTLPSSSSTLRTEHTRLSTNRPQGNMSLPSGLQLVISPLAVLVLQLLAIACLVVSLVLVSTIYNASARHLGDPPGAELGRDATAKAIISEEDDRIDGDLPDDNPRVRKKGASGQTPIALSRFRVALPSRADLDSNPQLSTQPTEPISHSSRPIITDAVSVHDGCTNQYGRDDKDDSYPLAEGGGMHIPIWTAPSLDNDSGDSKPLRIGWLRFVVVTATVLVLLSTAAAGITYGFTVSDDNDNSYDYGHGWPLEFVSQPLELWDDAWGTLEGWAECLEPLMPAEPPDHQSIFATFHDPPTSHFETLDSLFDQLEYVVRSDSLFETSGTDDHPDVKSTSELLWSMRVGLEKNIGGFEVDWARLISEFIRIWIPSAMDELWRIGHNMGDELETVKSRFTDASEPTCTTQAGSDSTGSNYPNWDNQTAIQFLIRADPSLPNLQAMAVDVISQLRSLQSRATAVALGIQAALDLVPPETARLAREEELGRPLLQRWTGFALSRWWNDEDAMFIQSAAELARHASDAARLRDLLHAVEPHIEESIRRTEASRASLYKLSQRVAALRDPRSREASASSLYGPWIVPGWKAECPCDSGKDLPAPDRVAATPVAVAYFVPSAETIRHGAGKTYQKIEIKREWAYQRRKHIEDEIWSKVKKEQEREDRAWRNKPITFSGCMNVTITNGEDGSKTVACLNIDEVRELVRRGTERILFDKSSKD